MLRLENPTVSASEERLVELHAQIVVLPVQAREVRPGPPARQRVLISGQDARPCGVDSAEVQVAVIHQLFGRMRYQLEESGFRYIDQRMRDVDCCIRVSTVTKLSDTSTNTF